MSATGDKIVVTKNRAGVYGCYKMDLDPNRMKDEYIIYLEEEPIGALVKRTDSEYFLLIPSCFLKGSIFASRYEPNHEVLRQYAEWHGIANTASYCFSITCGMKAIWKIATDMDISKGIRDRFTPEMAEAELKRLLERTGKTSQPTTAARTESKDKKSDVVVTGLLGDSDEYSYETLPQRIAELQDGECMFVWANDGVYLDMVDAKLNRRLVHTLTVQNFLPPNQ